jgi:hypothetical protein
MEIFETISDVIFNPYIILCCHTYVIERVVVRSNVCELDSFFSSLNPLLVGYGTQNRVLPVSLSKRNETTGCPFFEKTLHEEHISSLCIGA